MTRPRAGRWGVRRGLAAAALVALAAAAACGAPRAAKSTAAPRAAFTPTAAQEAFLDTLERRTFFWFWDLSDPRTGLTPDRWPTRSFSSISATGFALTAYGIGESRGWITRDQARTRTLATLRFFRDARQDTARAGSTGYRGFYYHFLDPATGTRFENVELSTVDTALLLAGALFAQTWFDRDDPAEREIRAIADTLMARADWTWATVRPPMVVLAWSPEEGALPYDWRGYNESMLIPLLALASTTHPADPAIWSNWTAACRWGTFEGQEHVGFGPLFGHHYSHLWWDFRGIQDSLMRAHGIDWAENARRATLAQRAYAIRNPSGFRGYGERLWGLSACDGPLDGAVVIDGRKREFHTYSARGASRDEIVDDGTIAPTAAGGSTAFAPEVSIPALMAMRADWGAQGFNAYGFVDALNPTLNVKADVHQGRIVPGVGWFDTDQLGIDQGPIVAMIENLRTGLVWRTMRRNAYVVRGLQRAGFTGGWLDSVATR